MTISTGDKLPDVTLYELADGAPGQVQLADKLAGRKVVMFGLPAAFSRTCDAQHVPSFIRTRDQFAAKGVDEIICISVNDPFVMGAWGLSTGATEAGIAMLGDATAELTTALGLKFDAPPAGLYGRCQRFAMLVEDGTVTALQTETAPGVCDLTAGESLLDAI